MGSVGFVGLGDIGAAMAERLLGQDLVVCDVNEAAVAPFVERGARTGTLSDLARDCDVISIVVRTDAQVRTVVTQLVEHATPGTVIAIHSTIEAETAPELAEAAAGRQVQILDAPVSGGAIGAHGGRLSVMVGGERSAYEVAKPVFMAWAELVLHMGPVGAGTQCKLARNLITFVSYAAAAEASRLAEAAGIDLRKLAAVVRTSDGVTGGPSAIMVRTATGPMAPDDGLRGPFEHARILAEKDLALALEQGRALGVDLPLAALALNSIGADLGLA